jgi:hypothetical protein
MRFIPSEIGYQNLATFDFYTESEQVCKFNDAIPLGITHSKQLCFRKPAKNEYKNNNNL